MDDKEIIYKTKLGDIKGVFDDGVIRVNAIPYATANRFEKPRAIVKYEAIVGGLKKSPFCPQSVKTNTKEIFGSDMLEGLEKSENCQNLSITIPKSILEKNEKLPIMVWIHGGSYKSGAGDSNIYETRQLVEEQSVIVVSITYRLGLLGFLGGFNDIPANLGLMDVIEALKWIKENISVFSGDENNITLFGQSSGADIIAQLLLVKETEDLFKNVILQSPPLGIIEDREEMYASMINVAKNIKKDASINSIIKQQKNVLKAGSGFRLKSGMPFGVRYGYTPLCEEKQIREIWQNRAKTTNILVGYTTDESAYFLPKFKQIKRLTNIPILGDILRALFIKTTTKRVYTRPTKKFAKLCAQTSNSVYLYEMYWGSETNGFGACHTIDQTLLFGDFSTWNGAKLIDGISQREIESKGKMLRKIWADFAKNGKLRKSGKIKSVLSYRKV